MPVEFYFLIITFWAITFFLFSIDYINKSAELDKKKNNVIDFDKFIKNKEAGDAVDSDIAELLNIHKNVA